MVVKRIVDYLKQKGYRIKEYENATKKVDGAIYFSDRMVLRVVENTEEVYLIFLNNEDVEISTELFDYNNIDMYLKNRELV